MPDSNLFPKIFKFLYVLPLMIQTLKIYTRLPNSDLAYGTS